MSGAFVQRLTTPCRVDPALRWIQLMQDGATPLHRAAYNGKSDAAALLLDRGAAIEAKDKVSGISLMQGVTWVHTLLAGRFMSGAFVQRLTTPCLVDPTMRWIP